MAPVLYKIQLNLSTTTTLETEEIKESMYGFFVRRDEKTWSL